MRDEQASVENGIKTRRSRNIREKKKRVLTRKWAKEKKDFSMKVTSGNPLKTDDL